MNRKYIFVLTLLALLMLAACGGQGYTVDDIIAARDDGYKSGYSTGHKDGVEEGYEKGYAEGFIDGSGSGDISFVANRSSHIYHALDCPSVKQISKGNIYYWSGTEEEIVDAGYSPHSSCLNKVSETKYDLNTVDFIETPNSTAVSQIGYEYDKGDVVVQFKDSGAYYVYYDVPTDVWAAFVDADSKGGYFNREIKGNYDCEKIEQ